MRDPGSDGSSASGPQGAQCRDDMVSVSISLGRINDALREAEKWIGDQTWRGIGADRWCQDEWQPARDAFIKLRDDMEQAQNACIAAADKADQAQAATTTH